MNNLLKKFFFSTTILGSLCFLRNAPSFGVGDERERSSIQKKAELNGQGYKKEDLQQIASAFARSGYRLSSLTYRDLSVWAKAAQLGHLQALFNIGRFVSSMKEEGYESDYKIIKILENLNTKDHPFRPSVLERSLEHYLKTRKLSAEISVVSPSIEPKDEQCSLGSKKSLMSSLAKLANSEFIFNKGNPIPKGYTLVLDPAQQRGTFGPLRVIPYVVGHITVEGDGYVFYYRLPAAEMKQLPNQSFVYEVEVKSNTPGVYTQYWGYPNHDKIQSACHSGDGRWQTLKLAFTVDKEDQAFYLYPAIMPGVAPGSKTPEVEIKEVKIWTIGEKI